MDLHSGMPYWVVLNPLYNFFNPLKKNIKTEVVVIGSGITGALVSHQLSDAGIKCIVVDKRTVGTGSSIASTSQLQYEIDVPLTKLAKDIGKQNAFKAYKYCLQSISDLEKTFHKIKKDPDFERIPTYFLASNKSGLDLLQKEFEIRKEANLPVEFLTKEQVAKKLKIDAPGALYNNTSAQLDCYKGATYLLDYNIKNSGLDVYSHTLIKEYKETNTGYELITDMGFTIKCNQVVIAAGFEAGEFLPKKVMDLLSTFAIISQPLDKKHIWKDKALIWETKEPYLYMRTTTDNRIIVGGEDEEYYDPDKRDDQLRDKAKMLEKKFKKMFPQIPFVKEMSWAGTFSATPDGLPFIGPWPGKPKMHYALGYGGNGITFSMIAAQVITNLILEQEDERATLFGFNRLDHA